VSCRLTPGTATALDYTALYKFGDFEAGLGGTFTAQLSNDTVHRTPVAAVPGGIGSAIGQSFTIGHPCSVMTLEKLR
jgi:hypothetical protein